jgi:hypothetical protein
MPRKHKVENQQATAAARMERGATEATDAVVGPRTPTHEQIAARAYELYLGRAGAPGSSEDDWLRAERELSQATAPPPAADDASQTRAPRRASRPQAGMTKSWLEARVGKA